MKPGDLVRVRIAVVDELLGKYAHNEWARSCLLVSEQTFPGGTGFLALGGDGEMCIITPMNVCNYEAIGLE